MLEITFDIPTIKKLEPKLYEHFGFALDDIFYELTQVYIRKSTNLTPEEKKNSPSNVKLKMAQQMLLNLH